MQRTQTNQTMKATKMFLAEKFKNLMAQVQTRSFTPDCPPEISTRRNAFKSPLFGCQGGLQFGKARRIY
jgi:hypothetical protein